MKTQFEIMPLSLALVLLLLGGCENKKKTENKEIANVQEETAFLEPDSYFENAIKYLDQNNLESAALEITYAIKYIESIEVQSDTVHTDIIEFSVSDLQELRDGILDGGITDSEVLKEEFSSIDRSLGMYHLHVIESWIKNETNDEKSLRRMHKALVRTSFAIDHAGLQLSDEEQAELQKAKEDLLNVEKPSLNLWKRIVKSVKKFDRMLEKNANGTDSKI